MNDFNIYMTRDQGDKVLMSYRHPIKATNSKKAVKKYVKEQNFKNPHLINALSAVLVIK